MVVLSVLGRARIILLKFAGEESVVKENHIQVKKWLEKEVPSEEWLVQQMEAEGFRPYRWQAAPEEVFQTHTHPFHKVIYVLQGSIIFGFPIDGEPTTLNPGDRLDLPAEVPHLAVAGPHGVVCLEAHVHKD
ncbi:MAG: cupin domain-containing protein [Candidatus Thermofonsia bacterium]|nr:MAG: cupin domain-containing protein [Candidatus Thermofonsia bacterium]